MELGDRFATLQEIHTMLGEVLAHPERYALTQSEQDLGTSEQVGITYHRLSCSVVFFDKTKLSVMTDGEGSNG